MVKLVRIFGFAVVSMAMAGGTAHAGFFTGSINAHFENPVLSGHVFGGGFFNNTSSVRYGIHGNGPIAAINWGTNAGSAPGSSTLIFSPNQDIEIGHSQEFHLGTVTLFNGTSTLESLIFGVDLVLDFIPTGATVAVDTLRLHVGIGTTFNGTDATSDADFISIPGISNSFYAFEGLSGSATVNGRIIGDPYMTVDSFTVLEKFSIYTGPTTPRDYDPADYTEFDSPGFTGGFTAPAATPEPASLALLATGALSVLGWRSVRRCNKSS